MISLGRFRNIRIELVPRQLIQYGNCGTNNNIQFTIIPIVPPLVPQFPYARKKGHSNHLSFIDPLEASSDLFEGDISGVKLTSVPEEQEEDSYVNENMKNAIKNTYQRWPEGEIPYVISNSFSSQERSIIR